MESFPTIKLAEYEGPFDLVLELVQKQRVDVSQVSMRDITNDFLTFIQTRRISPDLTAHFLVVASTLLLLKVRQLLPTLSEEEEQEIDELTDRIKIYQLYREQAQQFLRTWSTSKLLSLFPRARVLEESTAIPSFSAEDIARTYTHVLGHLPKPVHPGAHLVHQGRSLTDCFQLLHKRLRRVKQLVLQDTISGYSRQDAAMSFLAVLEMARKKEVDLEQQHPLGQLIVRKNNVAL